MKTWERQNGTGISLEQNGKFTNKLRVPYYVIFDRYTDQLRAFTLVSGQYQEINQRTSDLDAYAEDRVRAMVWRVPWDYPSMVALV